MRLLLSTALLSTTSAFMITTAPRAAHCNSVRCVALRASAEDGDGMKESWPWEEAKPKITMEGWEKIRERQRLRTQGAPISEWGKTANMPDGAVDLDKMEAHVPVPPTQEQCNAADALFETLLREDNLPEGFGDGIEDLDFGI